LNIVDVIHQSVSTDKLYFAHFFSQPL